ncbi:MAG: DUF983 domain-containing protein [Pseudomonadota bacterium]
MNTETGSVPQTAQTLMAAMRRGFFCRCPNCGEGKLFGKFLKVIDHCDVCGEVYHHHRADDFPAYIVIFIVGHIVVPLVLFTETHYAPPYWVHAVLWPAMVVGLSLALLQPVKGAIVALQWFVGMHGFDEAKKKRELLARQATAQQAAPQTVN